MIGALITVGIILIRCLILLVIEGFHGTVETVGDCLTLQRVIVPSRDSNYVKPDLKWLAEVTGLSNSNSITCLPFIHSVRPPFPRQQLQPIFSWIYAILLSYGR